MDQNISILREQTEQFIALDPTVATMKRQLRQAAPGGGYHNGEVTAGEHIIKLINNSGSNSGVVKGEGGQDKAYDLLGLAKWDADIREGDYWIDGTQKYVVKGFAPNNFYEKKFAIQTYGAKPDGG